jgi:hypothetical protein
MSSTAPSTEVEYTPYQEDFLARMRAEVRPGSVHLLLGPVGSGMSTGIARAVANLFRERRVGRVLLLAPSTSHCVRWADVLNQWELGAAVLDSRAFRQLQQDLGSANQWPVGVYVAGIDFAKRPEVRSLLSNTKWDFVVVDEAHRLDGQRRELVEELARRAPSPSILMASHFEGKGIETLSGSRTLIDWRAAVAQHFKERDGSAHPLVNRETRKYRRSTAEVAVAQHTQQIARQLGPAKGTALLRRALSSVSCLEETLIGWVESSASDLEHRDDLEALLVAVEQLGCDSRLACIEQTVDDVFASGVRHVVAMCEYRTTVDYLTAAFDRPKLRTFAHHGGLPFAERNQILEEFRSLGGLLVTTSDSCDGLSFSFVGAVVHYDLPLSPIAFALRERRYNKYWRHEPYTSYFLEDESRAFPFEDVLLRAFRSAHVATDDLDADFEEAMFQAVLG